MSRFTPLLVVLNDGFPEMPEDGVSQLPWVDPEPIAQVSHGA